jgi:hypothetical protein
MQKPNYGRVTNEPTAKETLILLRYPVAMSVDNKITVIVSTMKTVGVGCSELFIYQQL